MVNPCTCHPDDNPPRPCPQKYALSECRAAAMPTDKIPDEIMREARKLAAPFLSWDELERRIARALMARDKRAAEIARAFADSEEINALAGTASSTGVRSPGWIKDALHSNGVDVANSIAKSILTYGGRDEQR